MARSKEQIAADIAKLEENFAKEFNGHSPGDLIRHLIEEDLKARQMAYVCGVVGNYRGAELALALEVIAEKDVAPRYVPEPEPVATPLTWQPPKKLGKKRGPKPK
jgi:hypothetical protein